LGFFFVAATFLREIRPAGFFVWSEQNCTAPIAPTERPATAMFGAKVDYLKW
jgi:hypothetical protein